MKNITDTDLEQLGFIRTEVTAEQSGAKPFYYYAKDLSLQNNSFCLLSNASDERSKNKYWTIHIMEVPEYEITDRINLMTLLTALKLNITDKKFKKQFLTNGY